MTGDTNTNLSGNYLRKIVVAFAAALLLAGLIYVFYHVSYMLLIVFAGILLGVFLDGLATLLRKHIRMPRWLALTLVSLIILLILTAVGWFAGPRLATQFTRLAELIPNAIQNIQDKLMQYEWGRNLLAGRPGARDILPPVSEIVGSIKGIFSTTLGTLTTVLIILFIGIYTAADPNVYIDNGLRLVPKENRKRAREIVRSIGAAMRWWLVGRFASMAVVGLLTAGAMAIIGIPLALTLGFIAAVLSFVPYIGPITSAIPAVLVALTVDPFLTVWVIAAYTAVQTIESYLITPIIQQRAISIPPVVLITGQILMGVLAGLAGVFLATPLAVVVIVLIQTLYVQDTLGEDVKIMGVHDNEQG